MRPASIVALAIATAGLGWLWLDAVRTTPEYAPTERELTAQGRPVDYYLRGLHSQDMSPQGQPARTLTASELRHFADDKSTELVAPRLLVHRQARPPWQVDAELGWMSPNGKEIVLSGNVVLVRAADADQGPLTLRTTRLRYLPHEDYAETDEKVTVDTDFDHVEATGMQAWLQQPSRFRLQSKVKGRYVPR